MSSVIISGDTSGAITVSAPAVAGTNTLTLQAVTGTAALTSDVIGIGQTWQTVTRTSGVTYTNSTGRPIMVSVVISAQTTNQSTNLVVNGITVGVAGWLSLAGGSVPATLTTIVPSGGTYVVTSNGTYTAVELR